MNNIAEESDESLLKRKESLDSFLTNCAIAGIEMPEADTTEFIAVQDELARRKVSPPPKQKSWTDWMGVKIDHYLLNGQVSSGRFCFLFHSKNEEGDERVYKVARDPHDIVDHMQYATQALKVIPFQTGPVSPSCDQMVQLQIERLNELAGPLMVPVLTAGSWEGRKYYSMPLLTGMTLRQRIAQGETTQKQVLAIFLLLASYLESIPDTYHGDLTPDNVFLEFDQVGDVSGIKLLDPGYFGPLTCLEGEFDTCMISTPAYYPLLEPDDLMAIGICMWEILTGTHPLRDSSPANPKSVAQDIEDLINFRNSLLQPYLTPLTNAVLPSDLSDDINRDLEKTILACMHLRRDQNNKLTTDNGFEGFAQLKVQLQGFINQPQTDFSPT